MSAWSAVEAALREQPVLDVLVPGWVDRDGDVPEFRPQPVAVFLRLDEGFLRFRSAGRSDRLEVTAEDEVSLALDIFEDVEDEVILASLGEQFFGDGWSALSCTGVRCFLDGGSRADEGIVKCMGIELERRFTLFLDPTWPFGIKLGNGEDMGRWAEEYAAPGSGVHEWSKRFG